MGLGKTKSILDKANPIVCFVIALLVIAVWLHAMMASSSIFVIYVIYALLSVSSFYSLLFGKRINLEKRNCAPLVLLSTIFASIICVANYDIMQGSALKAIAIFATTLVITYPMFRWLYIGYEDFEYKLIQPTRRSLIAWFLIPFVIIVSIDIAYLFLVAFPGNITSDSLGQLHQIDSGVYGDHHPYYHTLIIGVFYKLGFAIFGSANAGVATYNVFQIILLASVFSFSIQTLRRVGVSPKLLTVITAAYALPPYQWMYSCTMWKDVIFGAFALLFTIILFKAIKNIGSKKFNYPMLFIASLGVCLFRSNGIPAFIVVSIVFLFLIYKNKQRCLWISVIALVVAIILKGPVLSLMNVQKTGFIESLSIPAQQIARVVLEEDLSEEDKDAIKTIMDVDMVPETYISWISDPVKSLLGKANADEAIINEPMKYIGLYISLGFKYPYTYLKAWVDETVGYWHGGYSYWVSTNHTESNDLGIERIVANPDIENANREILAFFDHGNIGRLFESPALCTWFYLVILFFGLMKRNSDGWIGAILPLSIVLTLLVSTPVANEFRYAYSLFTCMPFVGAWFFLGNNLD